MIGLLQYLPLLAWAVFAFAALFSILETEFRPLAILKASLFATARILTGHWRIAAALLAMFAMTPVLEAVVVQILEVRGRPVMLVALSWQAIEAGTIAWIATYIHGNTMTLPKRDAGEMVRYRVMSLVVGLALFLSGVALANGLVLALVAVGSHPRYHLDWFAHAAQTLIFVPMALVRPALSLGLRSPVRSVVFAAVKPPFAAAVWVTALGFPAAIFNSLGYDIVHAHPGLASVLAFKAAKVVFNVAITVFFETATLLLLARVKDLFHLYDEG